LAERFDAAAEPGHSGLGRQSRQTDEHRLSHLLQVCRQWARNDQATLLLRARQSTIGAVERGPTLPAKTIFQRVSRLTLRANSFHHTSISLIS
jgi:hypothetical protein